MLLLRIHLVFLFVAVASALQSHGILRYHLGMGVRHAVHHRRSLVNVSFAVELPIDHFGNGSGTFENRYWINDTYYDGGPVFVCDIGEENAEDFYATFLLEGRGVQSNVMTLARKYKGLAILWEHRYYGKSVPFQDTISDVNQFTVNEWKYLTVDQALEDLVVFAKNFTLPSNSQIKLKFPDALRPQNTPWIVIGASYSGVRAALLRVRNPEVVFASWASSAPVQAQINMASYFEAIERALPRNCSADWVAAIKYIDNTLMGNDTAQQLMVKRALYVAAESGPGGNTSLVQPLPDANITAILPDDLIGVLWYPIFTFQSYGLQIILPFCDRFETRNFTNSPAQQGLTATQGINTTFNAFMTAIAEIDKNALLAAQLDPSDALAWMWQYCSEFGFYQAADPNNPANIESTYDSLAKEQEWCDQAFNGQQPRPPNVTTVNKYGGWNMAPSNVFFSNGEYDPWRTLSVNSQESNSPQRNGSETVPACNSSPRFPSFFGTTYPQQVHAADTFLSPRKQGNQDAFNKGLTLFGSALDQWLPCYNASGTTRNTGGTPGRSQSSSSGLLLLSSALLSFLLSLILD